MENILLIVFKLEFNQKFSNNIIFKSQINIIISYYI